ncbi:MAG TPA: LamG domain-containing protein [Kofleriaceae bacterium]
MSRLFIAAVAVGAGCGRIDFGNALDAPPLTYREQVLADHPLGYWRLGDSGTVAVDQTMNGDGIYSGSCTSSPGTIALDLDRATAFDETGGCIVSLGDRFNFPGASAFTLEGWFSIQQRSGGEYVFIKEARTPGTAELPIDGYGLIVDSVGIYAERVVDSSLGMTDRIALAPRFTHVVYSYDGAQLSLYLDGERVSQVPDARVMRAFSADINVGGFDTTFALADGFIDEVAIYDHALSPERVSVHHDVGVNGP